MGSGNVVHSLVWLIQSGDFLRTRARDDRKVSLKGRYKKKYDHSGIIEMVIYLFICILIYLFSHLLMLYKNKYSLHFQHFLTTLSLCSYICDIVINIISSNTKLVLKYTKLISQQPTEFSYCIFMSFVFKSLFFSFLCDNYILPVWHLFPFF